MSKRSNEIAHLLAELKKFGLEADSGDLNALREAFQIELARRDPAEFQGFAFHDPSGKKWEVQPFQREWHALIPFRGQPCRLLIITPHESGKTSSIAVARVLWEIGTDPNIRVRIISSDDELAEAIVAELKQHITQNELLAKVFPHLKPSTPWDKTKFTVQRTAIMKDPTVHATSVIGSSTGWRVDLAIFDDVCTARNTILQPKLMPQVIDAFENVWMPSLTTDPPGRAVALNTPWHVNDNTARLEKNPAWTVWKRPARDPDTGKFLWPGRMDIEFLQGKKRDLGHRGFERGFNLVPFSQEERTFSDRAIVRDPSRGWGESVPPDWKVVGGLDPATTGQAVFLTAALDPETHRRLPLELVRMQARSPTEFGRAMVESFLRWKHQLILVENNATQGSFLDLIQVVRQTLGIFIPPIPLEGFYTGKQKFDETSGLPSLAASMEQGLWPIPMACRCGQVPCECHPPGHECDSCEWISELIAHPVGRSDVIMAQWLAEMAARRIEFSAGDGLIEEIPHRSILEEKF